MHIDRRSGDEEVRDAIIRNLGKQRYLTLIAIHTLDQQRLVAEHAALAYARGVDAINRVMASTEFLTPEDRAAVQELKDFYRRASQMTVAIAYEELLAQLEGSYASLDRSPVLPAPTSAWREFDRGVAEFVEGFTFGLIKAKHDA